MTRPTTTFKVIYPNGNQEEVTTDDATVEAFCNARFGSAWDTAKANGGSVEIIEPSPDAAEDTEAENLAAGKADHTAAELTAAEPGAGTPEQLPSL